MRIVSIIEASTVNAVAKGAIEFLRTSREMAEARGVAPAVEGSFITYDRRLDHRETPNDFVLATRAAGIEIAVIPERRRFDLSVIPAMRTLIEQRQPDLVVTHSVKSHFVMWRSGLAKKFPWLAFHHGYTTTDRKMRIYNRLDRWSLPKANQVLTVCQAFARELSAITAIPVEKILVQHNAIRPTPAPAAAVIQALRERLGIAADDFVLLSIGRLSKEKAHADLIAAFALLCRQNPDVRFKLLIVGDGPERAHLESAARTSGFSNKIIFIGCVPEVQPFYAMAGAFVLPSRSEGSPNVLLEAMAARVPVVATNVGGVPEIVSHDESALLVAANDPPALAIAMARSHSEGELARRLIANAEHLVATRYRPEMYAERLVGIYGSVVKAWKARE